MKRNTLIVIPHYNNEGGAGLFINSFLSSVREQYDLRIIGPFAKHYNDLVPIKQDDKINALFPFYSFVYPNYLGVRFFLKVYYLIKIMFFLPLLLVKGKQNSCGKMVFVLTSSIQIPLLFIIKKLFVNAKIVILIQENYLLNSLSAKVLNVILSKADLIGSISETWINESIKYGFSAQLLRNSFNNRIYSTQGHKIDYDILFLGGSQSIKGAHNFVSLLKIFNSKKLKFRVAWLGHLNNFYKTEIEKLKKEQFLFISSFGFVSEVTQIISRSQLIVFPIDKSHFLRPAIEAGLCKKTYVIKELDGVDDFAKSGYNCLSYRNLEQAADLILQLINDDTLRETLEINNFEFSQRFAQSASKDLTQFVDKLNYLYL